MTKRQIIDEIITINRSARPEFLAEFDDTELDRYLEHLRVIGTPRLSGDPHRFDKYFEDPPTTASARGRQAGRLVVLEEDDPPDQTAEDAAGGDRRRSRDAESASDHRDGDRSPFAKWRKGSGSRAS